MLELNCSNIICKEMFLPSTLQQCNKETQYYQAVHLAGQCTNPLNSMWQTLGSAMHHCICTCRRCRNTPLLVPDHIDSMIVQEAHLDVLQPFQTELTKKESVPETKPRSTTTPACEMTMSLLSRTNSRSNFLDFRQEV